MLNLNYEFKDETLLSLALTQSGADFTSNNERLEFLGDRVLGLTVAGLLYEMYPDEAEGALARRHAVLVSTDTLARVAKIVGLDTQLKHGHMTAGRMNRMLANGMEAVLGAMYLDGGFDAACAFVDGIWRTLATQDLLPPKDTKSKLQEYVQKHDNGKLPIYEYTGATGMPHAPEFHVQVTAMGHTMTGHGPNKKAASTAAAAAMLKILAISE